MPAKSVTYNSQNYTGTLGSGLYVSLYFGKQISKESLQSGIKLRFLDDSESCRSELIVVDPSRSM